MESSHKFSEAGDSFVRRYGIALLAAAGAIAVRLTLMPLLGTKPPYITFYLGIVIAAAFGGIGPGLLVTCIGIVFGFIVLPEGPVVIAQEAARLGLYLLSGIGICLIAEGMHRQRRKVQEQAQELQRAHSELELLIRERTEELLRKELLLERQSRQAAMGEMINNIAHQWRQPLNSLGLIIQSLAMVKGTGEPCPDALPDRVNRAMEIIQHMSQTIDDFRDYFKPDKERVPFHATQVVARTIRLTEDNFKAHKIGLHWPRRGESRLGASGRGGAPERKAEESRMGSVFGRRADDRPAGDDGDSPRGRSESCGQSSGSGPLGSPVASFPAVPHGC